VNCSSAWCGSDTASRSCARSAATSHCWNFRRAHLWRRAKQPRGGLCPQHSTALADPAPASAILAAPHDLALAGRAPALAAAYAAADGKAAAGGAIVT
jgi:hypothetical protein